MNQVDAIHAHASIVGQLQQLEDLPDIFLFVSPQYIFVDSLEAARKIVHAIGGYWEKDASDNYLNYIQGNLVVCVHKDLTCTKVQVGTRTVTRPILPEGTPTEEVEEPVYEWRCPPEWGKAE
jgi:hypothetical protein